MYGASVQGIQGFIFQTNKLREIVGASELVEQICTTEFQKWANIKADDSNILLSAAGNIKYVFTDKTRCEAFVKKFPRTIMELAPGITISQAVVVFEDELTKNDTQLLEKRLRIQRNRVVPIPSANLMVSEVSRKTGGAGVRFEDNEVIDLSQDKKRRASDIANKSLLSKIVGSESVSINKFPFDMEEIANKDEKSWLAIIHADGNNLGQKIMRMVDILDAKTVQKAMREFSIILNDSTVRAAKTAFEQVVGVNFDKKIPFRPVVLGGDDLTAIIRGDLAVPFTERFLAEFEKETKTNFNGFAAKFKMKEDMFAEGITACVGIAFIKSSYPFHYGVKLSESLCKEAKKISKQINDTQTPSSLVFHKVHASFVEEYDDIIEKELKAKSGIQFNYGPYFVKPQKDYLTIEQLQNYAKEINRKDAPKAGLRNWLTELQNNSSRAEQLLERTRALNTKFDKILGLRTPSVKRADGVKYTPYFDIISLSNIQTTR